MGFREKAKDFFNKVGGFFKKAGNTVYNKVLKPIYQSVLEPAYNKVIKPIGERALNLVTKNLDATTSIVEKVGSGVGNIVDSVSNNGTKVVNSLGKIQSNY